MEIIKGDCIFCNELIEIDETKEAVCLIVVKLL